MLENTFKSRLIQRIKDEFPGAVVLKNDATLFQGIPDNLILWGPRWAMFEAKRSPTATLRPNQKYWVEYLNKMSYASFVHPKNEEAFIHELQQALRY